MFLTYYRPKRWIPTINHSDSIEAASALLRSRAILTDTSPTSTGEPIATKGGTFRGLLEALRIPHWIKNVFVLAALVFSKQVGSASAWLMALAATAAFCLLSSAAYLINDVADRESDRTHPVKSRRPIASGRVSPTAAVATAIALLAAATVLIVLESLRLRWAGAPVGGMGLAVWAGTYLVLNLAYSFGLKGRPILDVLIVAMGFVFRAMAGAAAVMAVVSPWLVLCTLTLCLFIALAKRRSEIVVLGEAAGRTRRVHRFYTLANLDHMLAVSAGLAIATYCLYCTAPRTIANLGSAHMIWTIPLVIYGMFRYYCLTLQAGGDDPMRVLGRDKVMWLVVGAWILLVVAILKWGPCRSLQGIIS